MRASIRYAARRAALAAVARATRLAVPAGLDADDRDGWHPAVPAPAIDNRSDCGRNYSGGLWLPPRYLTCNLTQTYDPTRSRPRRPDHAGNGVRRPPGAAGAGSGSATKWPGAAGHPGQQGPPGQAAPADGIGIAARTKINANIGNSAVTSDIAVRAGEAPRGGPLRGRHGDGPLDRRGHRRHPPADHRGRAACRSAPCRSTRCRSNSTTSPTCGRSISWTWSSSRPGRASTT